MTILLDLGKHYHSDNLSYLLNCLPRNKSTYLLCSPRQKRILLNSGLLDQSKKIILYPDFFCLFLSFVSGFRIRSYFTRLSKNSYRIIFKLALRDALYIKLLVLFFPPIVLLLPAFYSSWLRSIKSHEIEKFILHTYPHSLNSWLVATLLENHGVNVIYNTYSFSPYHVLVHSGLKRYPNLISKVTTHLAHTSLFSQFINSRFSSMLNIAPYEEERIKANNGKLYSLRRDLSNFPANLLLVINKLLCYKTLQFLSRRFRQDSAKLDAKSALFLLHFEPERTTLPELCEFSSQLDCIKYIDSIFPNEYTIYVKEHPSTFTTFCLLPWRSPIFYVLIMLISDRIRFVPPSIVSLDNSSFDCVISPNGTVTSETLYNNQKVVCFAHSSLTGLSTSNIYRISGNHLESTKLKSFLNQSCENSNREISDYFISNCTIVDPINQLNLISSHHPLRQSSFNMSFLALRHLLSGL